VQEGAKFIWGHEKQSFMQQPGQAYKQWMKQLGLTYRIKAAFRVSSYSVIGVDHDRPKTGLVGP
jgi:hypothetical protein